MNNSNSYAKAKIYQHQQHPLTSKGRVVLLVLVLRPALYVYPYQSVGVGRSGSKSQLGAERQLLSPLPVCSPVARPVHMNLNP